MLQDSDLTPLERALCLAAAAGRLLDSRCRRSDEDDPARGRIWGKNRQIRAQVLRQLLTGEGCLDQTFGRPLAVRLRGASVRGRLNLGGRTVRCPLELYGCYLGGRLDLAKAEASDISLRGSHLAQRLSARRLRLMGLNLTGGFRCHSRVDLRWGHIGGQLDCEGATLSNPDGEALTADRLTVDGSLSLSRAEVTGEVRLVGAHVGGQLDCEGATLSNPGGEALHADRLTVDGSLFLRRAEVTGEVRLPGAHVGFQLVCQGATLSNPGGPALNLEGALVTGEVHMRPARLDGSINLIAARVGGWYDDRRTWPTALNLEGFVYDAIDGLEVTPKQRLRWLRHHQDGYLPQPYEQLASVYRRTGNDQAARTVVSTDPEY